MIDLRILGSRRCSRYSDNIIICIVLMCARPILETLLVSPTVHPWVRVFSCSVYTCFRVLFINSSTTIIWTREIGWLNRTSLSRWTYNAYITSRILYILYIREMNRPAGTLSGVYYCYYRNTSLPKITYTRRRRRLVMMMMASGAVHFGKWYTMILLVVFSRLLLILIYVNRNNIM